MGDNKLPPVAESKRKWPAFQNARERRPTCKGCVRQIKKYTHTAGAAGWHIQRTKPETG